MNVIQTLPTCNSFLNSSYMDLSTPDCYIIPIIGSSHAFIHIFCAAVGESSTLGFYPLNVHPNPETKQEEINAQKMPREAYPKWLNYLRVAFQGIGGLGFYGSSSGTTSMAFPSVFGGKYSGRNLVVSGFQVYSGVHSGVLLPSDTYDWYNQGKYKAPGKVASDWLARVNCLDQTDYCKGVVLRSTPNQVIKAFQYANEVNQNALDALRDPRYLDDKSKQNGVYTLFGNNCVDFTRGVMKAAGHKNWESKLQEYPPRYFSKTSFSEGFHIASKYLYLRYWLSP